MIKRAYQRHVLGRRYVIYDYTDYHVYRRNLPVTKQYFQVSMRALLGRLKDLKDARDAYDRKKNRKKIRWDIAPIAITLIAFSDITHTMTHTILLDTVTYSILNLSFELPLSLLTFVPFLVSNSAEYFVYAPSQLQVVFNFLPEIVFSLALLAILANVAVEKLRSMPPKLLAVGA